MSALVGRYFGSETLAEKVGEDWKVTVTITERQKVDDASDWVEKKLHATCTDKSFEAAYQVAMNSTLEQFNDSLLETKGEGLFEAPDKPEDDIS